MLNRFENHRQAALVAVPTCWPASYRGLGIWIEPLADGQYVGLGEEGYQSVPYPDIQQALADVTTWIESVTLAGAVTR